MGNVVFTLMCSLSCRDESVTKATEITLNTRAEVYVCVWAWVCMYVCVSVIL